VNWRKVYVLVEGQTEEGFVKNILRQEMPEGLYLQPVIVATKRVNTGGKFKGGVPSYPKVKDEDVRPIFRGARLSWEAVPTVKLPNDGRVSTLI
jgi:hypothetical protein